MSQHDFPGARLVYTMEQGADVLNCGRNEMYKAAKSGRLRTYKHGGRRRIAHCDLVAFIDEMREQEHARSPGSKLPTCQQLARMQDPAAALERHLEAAKQALAQAGDPQSRERARKAHERAERRWAEFFGDDERIARMRHPRKNPV